MEPLPRGDYLDRLIADMRGKLRRRMCKDCEGFRITADVDVTDPEESRLEFASRRTSIDIRVIPDYLRHPRSPNTVPLPAFIAGVVAGTVMDIHLDLSEDTWMYYSNEDPYQVTILSVGQGSEGHGTNVVHKLPLCDQLIDALRELARV